VLIRENLRLESNARIDGRDELIRKLNLKESPTDDELILHAYEAWGEDCVKHLIGDFAFAIWDDRKQRLFCARDHFGVKPFFYTHISNNFNCGSTLNDLRVDPNVSDKLNEIAVGDYLLFGVNQNLSTTIFKDIQRLPPGHSLTLSDGTIKIRRYWTPSCSDKVRFRDPASYVERFSELLSRAVKDRLRTSRVAVSMSGGLDSTSLAAVARTQLNDNSAVHGFCVVYDRVLPDEERHYSTIAANHLGIPITHLDGDRYPLFHEHEPGDMNQPEPFLLSPLAGQFHSLLRGCANFGPVALTGYDGDSFMNVPPPLKIRTRVKRQLYRKLPIHILLPRWVKRSFAKRTHLAERLKHSQTDPVDVASPLNPIWTALFEGYDPGATKLALEVRHPFMDVRLIEFLLSIPLSPWRINKHILRQSMKDQLPEAVLNRDKTPLAGDLTLQLATRASVRWLDSFEVSPQLRDFVDLSCRRKFLDEKTSDGRWANLRVFALNYWLLRSRRSSTNDLNRPDCLNMEIMHGT